MGKQLTLIPEEMVPTPKRGRAEYMRQWHIENRERVLARMAAYRKEHADEFKTRRLERYWKDPKAARAEVAEAYRKDPEKMRAPTITLRG
jgi:hypothetical protein